MSPDKHSQLDVPPYELLKDYDQPEYVSPPEKHVDVPLLQEMIRKAYSDFLGYELELVKRQQKQKLEPTTSMQLLPGIHVYKEEGEPRRFMINAGLFCDANMEGMGLLPVENREKAAAINKVAAKKAKAAAKRAAKKPWWKFC